jgi:hypothetical protein
VSAGARVKIRAQISYKNYVRPDVVPAWVATDAGMPSAGRTCESGA